MTTILTAVIAGVAILLAGNLPWAGFGRISGLSALNLRFGKALPWAVAPMALYLWAYWRFISGRWGEPSEAASRRANLRANRLPPGAWGARSPKGRLRDIGDARLDLEEP